MPKEHAKLKRTRGRPPEVKFSGYFEELIVQHKKCYRCNACGKEGSQRSAYRHLVQAKAGTCATRATRARHSATDRADGHNTVYDGFSLEAEDCTGTAGSMAWVDSYVQAMEPQADAAVLASRGLDISDLHLQDEMCGPEPATEDEAECSHAQHDPTEMGATPDDSIQALTFELQALDVDGPGPLDPYEVQAVRVGDGVEEEARRRRSAWHAVRFEKVHDGKDPATELTVIQAAFHHIEAVHKGSTLAQVNADIRRGLAMFGPECGPPAPDNPKCRYPPSLYLCKVICEVGDLSEAEVHVCPKSNCPHLFAFEYMPRQELLQHMKDCHLSTCRTCYCPCGGRRMSCPSEGCSPQPSAPCYFFKDVFQQFFLDQDWYAAAKRAREEGRGNLYSNPEGNRVMTEFEAAGVDCKEVWFWELASDGVEMRNFTPHGTQVFVVRCASVGEDLICKMRNVKPIMIIPGPTAPKNFAPYWKLIMRLFADASPLGGDQVSVDVVTSPGSAHIRAQAEQVQMYLALHAIHMDYIMRAHVTNWYGPSADHPGGWCKCYRGAPTALGKRAAERAGVSTARLWGYGAEISQPGIDDQQASCGDAKLLYTDAELIDLGERTHEIVAAMELGSKKARSRALRRLGLHSMDEAREELRRCGRRGRMPWCDPEFMQKLAYISAGDIMPVPISHCLLRGPLRSLMAFALTTKVSTVPEDHEVVFNSAEREKVEGLQGRVVFPSGFNRNYRCARKYILSYVIEELASLIFVGCYIAQCGPPGFRALWALLQPALLHYIFGMDDTEEQRNAAEQSLLEYAKLLEKFVKEGKVPSRLLSPNLHCAICRLPRQERKRGNAAKENELFMEREMNVIKGRSKYKTITRVETSFVRNTEATERSLVRNRAYHGCKSLYNHAILAQDRSFSVRGAGVRLKETLATTVHGLNRTSAVAVARVILSLADPERFSLETPADQGPSILDQLQLSVHTSAQAGGLKFECRHTPARSGRSRSYQNSFVRLDHRDVVSATLLPDGTVEPLNELHTVAGAVYVRVESFLQVYVQGCRRAYALVRVLKSPSRHLFAGTWTTVTVAPAGDAVISDQQIVALECFKAQILVLKGTTGITNVRFVECPEKLSMVYG